MAGRPAAFLDRAGALIDDIGFVGDRNDVARGYFDAAAVRDIELGQRAAFPGVLVTSPIPYTGPQPDFRARTLLEAAQWIARRGA